MKRLEIWTHNRTGVGVSLAGAFRGRTQRKLPQATWPIGQQVDSKWFVEEPLGISRPKGILSSLAFALVLAIALTSACEHMGNGGIAMNESQIIKIEEKMAQAIIENDVDVLREILTDDWIIVAPEGQVIQRAAFLNAITSGDLTHESMEFDDWRVRFYDDCAVATSVAKTEGAYKGKAFTTYERSTSVYVKQGERWRCVLTQLTAIANK